MKRAVVKNMFRTAALVSSGEEERKESRKLAQEIAASNGYKHHVTSSRRSLQEQSSSRAMSGKVPFKVPFISDDVSTSLRKCVRRAGLENVVTVVEVPPDNLRRQLVRNRPYDRLCVTPGCAVCPHGREGDCTLSGVVYLITCQSCGEEYIGETARPLHVRVKEHLDGKAKSRTSTAMGHHRVHGHTGEDFEVRVKLLAVEAQTAARKALEAFWIHAKDPKLNRKEECLYITRELRPYIRLAF